MRRLTLAASALALTALGSSETARTMVGGLAFDAAALFDGRSPGERDPGALLQTKQPRHRKGAVPRQRVLANERARPPAPAAAPPPEAAGASPSAQPADTAGAVPAGQGANPLTSGQQPLAAPDLVPAAGPIPNGATDPIPLPTPVVPEPDTYALLTIGIGIIGAAQRRRRRVAAASEPERRPNA